MSFDMLMWLKTMSRRETVHAVNLHSKHWPLCLSLVPPITASLPACPAPHYTEQYPRQQSTDSTNHWKTARRGTDNGRSEWKCEWNECTSSVHCFARQSTAV